MIEICGAPSSARMTKLRKFQPRPSSGLPISVKRIPIWLDRAGRLTGRHRDHDAATASLAVLRRRVTQMGGIFSTLWSGDDGDNGSHCCFCGTPDGPFLEVESFFALLLCGDCQAARSARRSAQLLADHDPQRLWWQWGCPLCEQRTSAPWDLEGPTRPGSIQGGQPGSRSCGPPATTAAGHLPPVGPARLGSEVRRWGRPATAAPSPGRLPRPLGNLGGRLAAAAAVRVGVITPARPCRTGSRSEGRGLESLLGSHCSTAQTRRRGRRSA